MFAFVLTTRTTNFAVDFNCKLYQSESEQKSCLHFLYILAKPDFKLFLLEVLKKTSTDARKSFKDLIFALSTCRSSTVNT